MIEFCEYDYVIFDDRGKIVERLKEDWDLSIQKLLGFDSFISELNNLKMYRQIKLLCWSVVRNDDISKINRTLASKGRW